MSDIVKICNVHGELTIDQCSITTKNKTLKSGSKSIYTWVACRKCNALVKSDWLRRNPEKAKNYHHSQREKRRKNPLITRKQLIKRKYGLSLEDYEKILKQQDNKCAICKKEDFTIEANSKRRKPLSIDHCHKTGKNRGLLCNRCNPMIGYSHDSIEVLENAIEYLRRYK